MEIDSLPFEQHALLRNAACSDDIEQNTMLIDPGSPRSKKNDRDDDSSPPIKFPSYNANALLNPKAAAKRALDDPTPKDIQSNTVDDTQNLNARNGADFGSMIERRHGVTKREALPQKRIKTDHEQDDNDASKKNKTFVGGGKGGVIGEYVKQKRAEGQEEAGPDVVELSDDEVTIISSTTPDPSREVCLGTIRAAVNAHRVPSTTNKLTENTKDRWPVTKIQLVRAITGGLVFEVHDKLGKHFGHLDARTASALAPLANATSLHKLRWNALLESRERREGEKPGDHTSQSLGSTITLFAQAKFAEGIGRHLSQRQVFLGQPLNSEGKEVLNPHLPKLSVVPKSFQSRVSTSALSSSSIGGYTSRTVEDIRSDVLGMFDKIANTDDLPRMDGDMSMLKTELLDHQKQALHFLTQRETPTAAGEDPDTTLWKPTYRKDGSKIYYNVISGDEVSKVEDCFGVVFADMMGLGKTLSTLSRIVATVSEARAFGEQNLPKDLLDSDVVERNACGTLIICPKSVLSNWDEQIRTHIKRNKLKVYSYHGPNREQDIDVLAGYDIVITSYSIVANELSMSTSKYKALGRLNWFRIVLDEAHMIRNQGTSTFKAACALESKRRWAVTGTPVQNRLDDLGALIRFIRISPFHEKSSFERHFLAPFKTGDTQVLDNLRLLVDSITLRRSKDKIDLPRKDEITIRLDFSEDERRLYEAFARDSRQKMNALVNAGGLRGRSYAHMLTFITRLRLICAHGRDLLSEEDMKVLSGTSVDNAIDLGEEDDDKPALTDAQVYNMFYMQIESSMNYCYKCAEFVNAESDEDDENDSDDVFAYMTSCFHILCKGCIKSFRQDLNATATSDGFGTCPSCSQHIKLQLSEILRSGVIAEQDRRAEIRRNPTKAKNIGNYNGPHTKVKHLVKQLTDHRAESELLPDEPPIRSVVFSGWTQYLDLIGLALTEAGFTYLRLDGKMSVSARTKVLAQFRTDPSISVILVSIKAGGQGLNFTAANKVYMMEPQFNPGVEMQAVDRVHRLGQTRDVEIVKYIMTDSFEEKIVTLQKQKMELARTAFQEGKKGGLSKQEEAKKRMEDLRSLFR